MKILHLRIKYLVDRDNWQRDNVLVEPQADDTIPTYTRKGKAFDIHSDGLNSLIRTD